MGLNSERAKELAFACGFELAGVAPAEPLEDYARFNEWRLQGRAGEMNYLTDHRGNLRSDPRNLLPEAKSIVCVGKLYNTSHPHSTESLEPQRGWISRYAWGSRDYHDVLREALERLQKLLAEEEPAPFYARVCVDTAPLLERSLARRAGLGWIGKNTCLINQQQGSWFFLGELLLSIPLETDTPAPERCGVCTRCIDACPTQAIVPNSDGSWSIDARLCISYLTIEKRGAIPPSMVGKTTHHLFGCDVCQDVCPWNGRAPVSAEEVFEPVALAPSLSAMAELSEGEFGAMFRHSPVWRAKYAGFLRNVALAMGNSGRPEMRQPLRKLMAHQDNIISAAAESALAVLERNLAGVT